ncbi:hypothetical protein [Kitasatospora phosalacinea]|uniref:hypothetical protein n=1 Tax=Kitasatospora phosalacinea TaxID=2065 RepID=UPI0005266A69|nr:hypothetical protein [Kitasatospora phosalacinea]
MPVINEPRRPQGGHPVSAPPRVPDPADAHGRPADLHGRPADAHGRPAGPPSFGHQAAAQLLGLREVVLPAAVIAAADLLLGDALDSDDPVTREAAAATRGRLRAALGQA